MGGLTMYFRFLAFCLLLGSQPVLAKGSAPLKLSDLPLCSKTLLSSELPDSMFVVGVAHAQQDGKLAPVYCEYHFKPGRLVSGVELDRALLQSSSLDKSSIDSIGNPPEDTAIVVYRAVDQRIIASKTLRYQREAFPILHKDIQATSGKNIASWLASSLVPGMEAAGAGVAFPTSPDFTLLDFRSGKRVEGRSEIAPREKPFAVTVRYRKTGDSKVASKRLNFSAQPVMDAGFVNAIRNSWPSLARGESIKVPFVSPMHQRSITLRVKRRGVDACDQSISSLLPEASLQDSEKRDQDSQNKTSRNDGLVCLEVSSASSLLRLFTSRIYLLYHPTRQQLRYFKGISNLEDDSGDDLAVEIYYSF